MKNLLIGITSSKEDKGDMAFEGGATNDATRGMNVGHESRVECDLNVRPGSRSAAAFFHSFVLF